MSISTSSPTPPYTYVTDAPVECQVICRECHTEQTCEVTFTYASYGLTSCDVRCLECGEEWDDGEDCIEWVDDGDGRIEWAEVDAY